MIARRVAAVLVVMALVFGSVFGSAGPAAAGSPLTKRETSRMVDYLLREFIAPAVTNSTRAKVRTKVWGCRVHSRRKGTCEGRLVVGLVTCEGRFRVAKSRRDLFAAWPVRMVCESENAS